MSAAQILKKSRPSAYSVQDEMAGRVPEKDFMDYRDRNFARASSYHTIPATGNTEPISRSGSFTYSSSDSSRPWHSTESSLLATDGFDLNRATQDPVVEPGTSLVLNSTRVPVQPARAWKGSQLLLQQAREYLTGTLASLRTETEIVGAFDTNQQKSGALKAFVPLEEYSDARNRERAKASFQQNRDAYFEKMDPLPAEDTMAPFLERPEAYAIFRDLDARCKTKWINRDELAFDEAVNAERPVIEYVSPSYCESFRYPREYSHRLRAKERRLCRNGNRCVCKLMNPVRGYVGVEFLTPRENRHFEETGTYVRGVTHLCVDCELAWYTEHFYFGCHTDDTGATSAIHRFRVVCEEGAYSKRTMLPTVLGSNTLTGIVGMIPTFNENYRIYIPIENATDAYRVTEVNVGF